MGNTYKGTDDQALTQAEKTLLMLGNIPEHQIIMNNVNINIQLKFFQEMHAIKYRNSNQVDTAVSMVDLRSNEPILSEDGE